MLQFYLLVLLYCWELGKAFSMLGWTLRKTTETDNARQLLEHYVTTDQRYTLGPTTAWTDGKVYCDCDRWCDKAAQKKQFRLILQNYYETAKTPIVRSAVANAIGLINKSSANTKTE